MSIRGAIRTMSVLDLFDWIERRGLAGEITLDWASTTRRFQVAGAAVSGASSTDPAEYLGQILVNAGHIDDQQLTDAYAQQTSNGISLGKILVLSGLVSEQALREAIELKIRESLFAALSWEEGGFLFEPREGPRAIELELALPLRPLLEEAGPRIEEWRKIRAHVPRDDARFFVPDRSWLDRAKPGSPSALILADVLAGRSAREIALARRSLPFPVYQRIAELAQRGILKLDRRAEPRPQAQSHEAQTPAALIAAARGRARRDPAGALELARRAVAAAPGDAELREELQAIERKLFAELARRLLATFRVPRLLKKEEELRALELTDEERDLLGRIDGKWDLLSLMRGSPLREVDALIALQRLADRGVIAL